MSCRTRRDLPVDYHTPPDHPRQASGFFTGRCGCSPPGSYGSWIPASSGTTGSIPKAGKDPPTNVNRTQMSAGITSLAVAVGRWARREGSNAEEGIAPR